MNTRIKSIVKNLPFTFYYDIFTSPVGNLCLVVTDFKVHALLWDCDLSEEIKQKLKQNRYSKDHTLITETKQQLTEYFEGKREKFSVPVCLQGTEFQQKTWKSLQSIPFGKTISYGQQAKLLGNVNKVRAVGTANGKNPISIIIPCHRVIGKDGSLTGYAGGVSIKEKLLMIENVKAL